MDIWSSALISLFLLLCAAGLMVSHVRTWRRVQSQQPEAAERDYHRRQFRRRMQTSAMLGVLAVGILLGRLLMSFGAPPLVIFLYWTGVILLVLWLALLAVADMLATKHYFGRLRQDYLIEQAKLQAEVRRIQAARRNGKGKAKRRPPPDES
jgi:predicted lipid-binding transport protein (Tim44 family)